MLGGFHIFPLGLQPPVLMGTGPSWKLREEMRISFSLISEGSMSKICVSFKLSGIMGAFLEMKGSLKLCIEELISGTFSHVFFTLHLRFILLSDQKHVLLPV